MKTEVTQSTYTIVKKEMDELLFRIWLLDGKSTTTNTVLGFSTQEKPATKPLISFNTDVPLTACEKNKLDDMYQQVITILREAYGCLQKGGAVNFTNFSKSGKTNVEQTMATPQELIEWIEGFDNFGMNTSKSQKIILQALQAK